jgi:ribosomal protein L37AE/L43A
MLIEIRQMQQEYQRPSKQGTLHTYVRTHKVAILQCDSCRAKFTRRVRDMDPRRLTLDHSHVCSDCDQKNYAQRKGVENKRFWNTTVDLDQDIDSI